MTICPAYREGLKVLFTFPELVSGHSEAAVERNLFIPVHEVCHPFFFC